MAYFNFPFGGGMPHGHGGGGGGGGQNGGGRGAAPKKAEDDGALYKALELEKNATADQIKKSFRVLAMKHHPDKGGDQEKFKEISKAYEILSNPQKKELYDQYGMEGVEAGGNPNGGGMGGADLFDILSGGGRRRDPNAKRRGEDVVFPLKVSLEDLYNGMSKKLRLTKNVLCKDCDGKGGKAGSDVTCKDCKGQGIVIRIRQLGPGMIQQMQTTCDKCNGEGTTMKEADKCKGCKGAKVVKEKKTLEVFVTKGMKHGERIPFKGEADEAPNTIPGDVLVVLQQKEHEVFKRDGNNLFMKKQITLQESLCGFHLRVTHLDGRVLRVHCEDIVTPGSYKKVAEEGMPLPKNQFQRGALYVEFDVVFPKSSELDSKTRSALAKILPTPPAAATATPMDTGKSTETGKDAEGTVEEVALVDVNIEEERAKFEKQHKEAYDDDEQEHRGRGGQAGCRAQ